MRRIGKEELSVIAEIARMYYVEGMSQRRIADILYFSGAKVSRAIKLAREQNIVEFHINYPLRRSLLLEAELKRSFYLENALVVTDLYDNGSADISIKRIGEMAACYLEETLKDGDRVGLSWGRTMYQTVSQLRPKEPRQIQVIQLVGSSAKDYEASLEAPALVQEMARAFHGTYSLLYAPMYISNDIVRRELMKERVIKKTLDEIRSADYIVTGIGDVSISQKPVTWAGFLSPQKKQALMKKGAVGYLCGYFFDKEGERLQDPMNDRIIGIEFEEIKKIPHVIVAAGGLDKTNAIFSAIRGGLVDCLITDSRIAEKLLALDRHVNEKKRRL